MNHRTKSKRFRSGQGLVEYALIISLVALVTIVVLVLAGSQIQNIYCEIAMSLGESNMDIEADLESCISPTVSCNLLSTGPGTINLQGVTNDRDDNVSRVEFYVDGVLRQIEVNSLYCLGGGDASCTNYNTSSGSHTIRAVVYDADNHSGECTIEVNVP